MSKVDQLIQRIDREDKELAKMRLEIQEILDLAASRGIHIQLSGYQAGNAVSKPDRARCPNGLEEQRP